MGISFSLVRSSEFVVEKGLLRRSYYPRSSHSPCSPGQVKRKVLTPTQYMRYTYLYS